MYRVFVTFLVSSSSFPAFTMKTFLPLLSCPLFLRSVSLSSFSICKDISDPSSSKVQDHAYSDFALAMQLQQEEQERARLADEREPHPTAAANRARERQEEQASFSQMIADRHEPSLSSRRVEGEQRGSEETQQHRDKFWRRRRSSSSEAEGESGRKQDSSCDIM